MVVKRRRSLKRRSVSKRRTKATKAATSRKRVRRTTRAKRTRTRARTTTRAKRTTRAKSTRRARRTRTTRARRTRSRRSRKDAWDRIKIERYPVRFAAVMSNDDRVKTSDVLDFLDKKRVTPDIRNEVLSEFRVGLNKNRQKRLHKLKLDTFDVREHFKSRLSG